MKKILLKSLLVACSLFTLSCDDDDSSSKATGKFTFMGETFNIKGALVMDGGPADGPDGTIYTRTILFPDAAITSEEDFNLVSIALYTNNEGMNIPEGTYEFDENEQAFSWYTGSVYNGADFQFEEGKVIVERSGNTHKISLEMTASNGEVVILSYKGTLTEFDFNP